MFTSNDSDFSVANHVGSFTAAIDGAGLGAPGTALQIFDLVDTAARYLRIDVLTVDPASPAFGWSEVAFDTGANTVPVPATLALFGLGLIGVAGSRRLGSTRRSA